MEPVMRRGALSIEWLIELALTFDGLKWSQLDFVPCVFRHLGQDETVPFLHGHAGNNGHLKALDPQDWDRLFQSKRLVWRGVRFEGQEHVAGGNRTSLVEEPPVPTGAEFAGLETSTGADLRRVHRADRSSGNAQPED